MKTIDFYKMSGSGNDFIIIDNCKGLLPSSDAGELARMLCRPKLSLGADGLILIEASTKVDFKWLFLNSDGSIAEMCGNGARCVARYAYLKGIAGPRLSFETDAGIIKAEVLGDRVKVRMTDPYGLMLDQPLRLRGTKVSIHRVNTGVPHAVLEVADVNVVDVVALGREIRYHSEFGAPGTNANFAAYLADGGVAVRTYERGVEDETLACGTGCVAAALVMSAKKGVDGPLTVQTRSQNRLRVHFNRTSEGFENVYLEGDARVIASGQLHEDAWNYIAPPFNI